MMEEDTANLSSQQTNWSSMESVEPGLMSASAYMWTAVYLILLSVIGFFMNLMVAVIIIKDKMVSVRFITFIFHLVPMIALEVPFLQHSAG